MEYYRGQEGPIARALRGYTTSLILIMTLTLPHACNASSPIRRTGGVLTRTDRPTCMQAHYRRACAAAMAQNWDAALADMTRAAELEPGDVTILRRLAEIAKRVKHREKLERRAFRNMLS